MKIYYSPFSSQFSPKRGCHHCSISHFYCCYLQLPSVALPKSFWTFFPQIMIEELRHLWLMKVRIQPLSRMYEKYSCSLQKKKVFLVTLQNVAQCFKITKSVSQTYYVSNATFLVSFKHWVFYWRKNIIIDCSDQLSSDWFSRSTKKAEKKEFSFCQMYFDSLSGQPNNIKVALDVSNIPHLDEKNEV